MSAIYTHLLSDITEEKTFTDRNAARIPLDQKIPVPFVHIDNLG
jgi:hypothetical protein